MRWGMTWRRGLALVGLLGCLGGCAVMALSLEKPDVRVVGIELGEGNLLEQRLRLTLRVSNPNNRDIAIDGLTFAFEVNGRDLAKGVQGQPAVLPKLSDTTLEVDGRASLFELIRQLPNLLDQGGKLRYRLHGEVVTRDYGRLPFNRRGELSAEEIGRRMLSKGEGVERL